MERMQEGLEFKEDRPIIIASSYEKYVGELASRMTLPKNWQETASKMDPLTIPTFAEQIAPYVVVGEGTKVKLEMRNENGQFITTNSEIKIPKTKQESKQSSISTKLAVLAEAEARLQAALRSDNVSDYSIYGAYGIKNRIKQLHSEAERIIDGKDRLPRRKVASSVVSLAIAASACAPVAAKTVSAEPVLTNEDRVATIIALQNGQRATEQPKSAPTIEPTKFPDGTFYPQREAFLSTNIGNLKSIEQIVLNDPSFTEIMNIAKEKYNITDDNIEVYGFQIRGENGEKPFMFTLNKETGKYDAVYKKDKTTGYYQPINGQGEIVFLPMIKGPYKDGKVSWGFDVAGGMLTPIFTYSPETGKTIFTDPETGGSLEISTESSIKVLALLVNPLEPLTTSVGDKITSDMLGEEGITEKMIDGVVTTEQGLPFKFLINSENKKVAVFMDGEWGEYMDIEVVNYKESKDVKAEDIPQVTLENVKSGAWANRIKVELFKMGLDRQNVEPKKISYSLGYNVDAPYVSPWVQFDYNKLSPEDRATILTNWKQDAQIPLFPSVLILDDGKSRPMLTERVSQNDPNNPYILFNLLITGRSDSVAKTSASIITEGFGKNFFDNIRLNPAPDVQEFYQKEGKELPMTTWKNAANSEYLDYLIDLGFYGTNGTVKSLLNELVQNESTSQEINNTILIHSNVSFIIP